MGMAVKDRFHFVAHQWLFEPGRSEKRIDLERLALDRRGDRRVVEQRHPRDRRRRASAVSSFNASATVSWTKSLISLAPGPERAGAEAAAESLDAGEADTAISIASPSSTWTPRHQDLAHGSSCPDS